MKYELAKKLRDAGFPFDWEYILEDVRGWNIEGVAPTLSELIEACGDGIHLIGDKGLTKQKWVAYIGEKVCSGESPEEAVSRLWLALNKPKSEV